jgi:hypothetical protein
MRAWASPSSRAYRASPPRPGTRRLPRLVHPARHLPLPPRELVRRTRRNCAPQCLRPPRCRVRQRLRGRPDRSLRLQLALLRDPLRRRGRRRQPPLPNWRPRARPPSVLSPHRRLLLGLRGPPDHARSRLRPGRRRRRPRAPHRRQARRRKREPLRRLLRRAVCRPQVQLQRSRHRPRLRSGFRFHPPGLRLARPHRRRPRARTQRPYRRRLLRRARPSQRAQPLRRRPRLRLPPRRPRPRQLRRLRRCRSRRRIVVLPLAGPHPLSPPPRPRCSLRRRSQRHGLHRAMRCRSPDLRARSAARSRSPCHRLRRRRRAPQRR